MQKGNRANGTRVNRDPTVYTYVCMHVCVCVYVCMYVCLYVCMYTHTHTHTYREYLPHKINVFQNLLVSRSIIGYTNVLVAYSDQS